MLLLWLVCGLRLRLLINLLRHLLLVNRLRYLLLINLLHGLLWLIHRLSLLDWSRLLLHSDRRIRVGWHAVTSSLAVTVEIDACIDQSLDEKDTAAHPLARLEKMIEVKVDVTYNSSPPSPAAAAIALRYV